MTLDCVKTMGATAAKRAACRGSRGCLCPCRAASFFYVTNPTRGGRRPQRVQLAFFLCVFFAGAAAFITAFVFVVPPAFFIVFFVGILVGPLRIFFQHQLYQIMSSMRSEFATTR